MYKIFLFTLFFILSSRAISQEVVTDSSTVIDKFISSGQHLTIEDLEDAIPIKSILNERDFKSNNTDFILDSLFERQGVLQLSNSYLPTRLKYTSETLNSENGVSIKLVSEDCFIGSNLISRRIFEMIEVGGVYTTKQSVYASKDNIKNIRSSNDCNIDFEIINSQKLYISNLDNYDYEIIIYSTSGQEIYHESYIPESKISIDDIAKKGVYFVFVYNKTNNSWCKGKLLNFN